MSNGFILILLSLISVQAARYNCAGLRTETRGSCYFSSCYGWRNTRCSWPDCVCRSNNYTPDQERCEPCPIEYDSCTSPDAVHTATQDITRFETNVVNAPDSCNSETRTRTCNDGTWGGWSGSFTHSTCTENAMCSGNIVHGTEQSRTMCEFASVNAPNTCNCETQTRTCSNGIFTGWTESYAQASCTVNARCTNPDREHGDVDSRVRYASSTVIAPALCVAETQTRTCSNGNYGDWTDTYTATDCIVYAQCTNPDILHGATDRRTRYENYQVNSPDTCISEDQTRTCDNGSFTIWSDTFLHDSCTVNAACACVGPQCDDDITHGQSQTRIRYETATVNAPATCQSEEQSQICNDGNFEQWIPANYEISSCDVLAQCSHSGDNGDELVTHGGTVTRTRYLHSEVNEPETCFSEEQIKICEDEDFTDWAPSNYQYDACIVKAECHDPPNTHGDVDSRVRYMNNIVNAPATCDEETQTRTCDDGTYSDWSPNNYNYSSCAINAQCQDPLTQHGDVDTRIRYISEFVHFPETCDSETQSRLCDDGAFLDWVPFNFEATSCKVLTDAPSVSPTVLPSRSPSINCNGVKDGDKCRQEGCAWSPHLNLCTFICLILEDQGVTGTKILDDADYDTLDECEQICLDEWECTRFAYTGNTCSIYGETWGEPYSHGTTSGICFHTHYPTMVPTVYPTEIPTMIPTIIPTLAPSTDEPSIFPSMNPTTDSPSTNPTLSFPSVSPTQCPTTDQPSMNPTTDQPSAVPSGLPTSDEPTVAPSALPTTDEPTNLPTSDSPTVPPSVAPSTRPSMLPSMNCHDITSDKNCRAAYCAWKPHENKCEFSCEELLNTAITGATIVDENGSEHRIRDSWYDCEVECLETYHCERFTFTLGTRTCILYSTYSDEIVSPGTTAGICLHTFVPTVVPTVIPTVIPTELPTMVPTYIPTLPPSTTKPTDKPSVTPTVGPTQHPSTDSPTVTPTASPSVDPSTAPSQSPSVDPTVQPTGHPSTDQPSGVPTITPLAAANTRREIAFEGNYQVVIGDNYPQFLTECDVEMATYDVICYGARSGSIILTLEGTFDNIVNAMNYIIQNGLNLPSFAPLTISSEFADTWEHAEEEDKPFYEEYLDKLLDDRMYQIIAGASLAALFFCCCMCRRMRSSDKNKGDILELADVMSTLDNTGIARPSVHTSGAVEMMTTPRSPFEKYVPLKVASNDSEGRRKSQEDLEVYGAKRQPMIIDASRGENFDDLDITPGGLHVTPGGFGLPVGNSDKLTAPVAAQFLNRKGSSGLYNSDNDSHEGGAVFSDSEGGDGESNATNSIRLLRGDSNNSTGGRKISAEEPMWDGYVDTGGIGLMVHSNSSNLPPSANLDHEPDGDETVALHSVFGHSMPDPVLSGDEDRLYAEGDRTDDHVTGGGNLDN